MASHMALPSDLITVSLYRNVNVDIGGQFYLRKVYSKDEINLITKVPECPELYDNIIDSNNEDAPANWGAKTPFISLMQFLDDKKQD